MRPGLHFTARRHWLNDPNGLVYVGGVYHLFYQYNPFASDHGYMSWGHAVSRDLLHWQEREVALPWREGHDIFSGSAVVDWHNTSGFGRPEDLHPPVVAHYTGNGSFWQAQYLALSRDAGFTWETLHQTPVLDEGKQDFRDPKTFWHGPSGQWVSVVVHPQERQIGLYGSADLHHWQLLSYFGPAGEVAGIWEVPDLFPLRVNDPEGGQERLCQERLWVMKVDTFADGPQGGPGAQYWVGEFDGQTFVPRSGPQWADYGKDFYAAVTFSDLPDEQQRTVWLAWMNSWEYASALPTAPWRGAMTVPRELGLERTAGPSGEETFVLVQRPIREIESLRRHRTEIGPDEVYEFTPGTPLDLLIQAPAGFALTLGPAPGSAPGSAAGTGTRSEATLSVQGDQLRLERGGHPAAAGFAGVHTVQLPADQRTAAVRVLVDTCSVEVFAAGGRVCLTDLLLPGQPLQRLTLTGKGARADLWTLASPMNPQDRAPAEL